MRDGLFIVFEGGDASGKSTQARRTAELHDAHFTFEPGDTPLGVDLRRWVLSDRSHHVRTVIRPMLERGQSVVSDRFFASTLAYQGYGRGVDLAKLQAATDLAIDSCRPDLTILIDLPLDVANERRAFDARDRFESADLDFHQRVRDGYLAIAAAHGDAWFVVDGSKSEDEVAAEIDQRLAGLPWSDG